MNRQMSHSGQFFFFEGFPNSIIRTASKKGLKAAKVLLNY